MTAEQKWPRVAVVGAGAVGGYFGAMLARAGAPVTMIGRRAFVEAVEGNGLVIDSVNFKESVRVDASTELADARGADVILFCVKTVDNAATSKELASVLAPGALLVSLQNGVDNAEQIHAASGIEAIPSVVYIGAFVPEPGIVKHGGRGDLVLGPENEKTKRVAELFIRAGVPVRLSANIAGDQWAKFLANCALNAISALSRTQYGRIAEDAETWKLVEQTIAEVLAVGKASGISLGVLAQLPEASALARKISTQIPEAFSSTAQDLMRGKRTEIDSLNGYIARRGAALGVATPMNHALWTLVKLAESSSTHVAMAKSAS